ncbi:MAG: hypothetical protein GX803_06420 [Lentisphaerae bacterium]|jgi:hypothetical protein|nr:hypothetical protein [Lentisphaerota bacterium]
MSEQAPASPASAPSNAPAIWLTLIGTLAFIFIFPRALLRWFEPGSPWIPYVHLYGLGLVTFLIGIQIILKSRACQFGRGRDSFWFGVLIAGYVFFVAMHGIWILAALYLPFKGGN